MQPISRRTVLAAALLAGALGACTSGSSSTSSTGAATPPAEDTDAATEAATDERAVSPSSPETLSGAPWAAAWPVEGGVVVPSGSGRLLSASGTSVVEGGTPCGDAGVKVAGEGVLHLPEGEALTFHKAPAVSAALVERAAWRLADIASPTEGIVPGVDAPDPALHQGIRVRSVRKLRRQGAPFQLLLGERDADVLVALTDKEASRVLAGQVLRRSDDAPMELAIIPTEDLDGDGTQEAVVFGDGSSGHFRAVLEVDLVRGGLSVRTFEEHAPVSCPEE